MRGQPPKSVCQFVPSSAVPFTQSVYPLLITFAAFPVKSVIYVSAVSDQVLVSSRRTETVPVSAETCVPFAFVISPPKPSGGAPSGDVPPGGVPVWKHYPVCLKYT